MLAANAALFARRPRFLAEIAASNANFRIERAKSGAPVAVGADERWLGSRYDPSRDAERWVLAQNLRAGDLPILVGFQLQIAMALAVRNRPVIVVERDASLLRAWLAGVDLAPSLDGITVIHDDDGFRTISAVRNLFDPFVHSCVRVLPSPFAMDRHTAGVDRHTAGMDRHTAGEDDAWIKRIAESALHIQREVSLNALSHAYQLPKWLATAQSNFESWLDGPDGNSIVDALAGETAVLVGAGPSLDRNVAGLRSLQGRALIVAVDTALRRLDAEGITPDVIVAVDANDANALDIVGLSQRVLSSILVADTIASPAIVRSCRGPRVFFRSINFSFDLEDAPIPIRQPFDALLTEIAGRDTIASWQSGGSVSTNAFCLIHYLGIRRVIFVGQDMAFTSGRAHASGVGYEEDGIPRFDRFQSRETVERRVVTPGRVMVPGWNGRPVATSEVMREYIRWFEMTMSRGFGCEMDVIDATEGGAMKKGARAMPLSEAARLVQGSSRPGDRLRHRLETAPRAGREGWRERLVAARERASLCAGDPEMIEAQLPLARWLALPAWMGSREMPPDERNALIAAAFRSACDFIVTALGKKMG